jgi:hypothetical protein
VASLEYCTHCGEPTGNAGEHEDSFYCEDEDCGVGPFCETCDEHHTQHYPHAKIKSQRKEIERLTTALVDRDKVCKKAEADATKLQTRPRQWRTRIDAHGISVGGTQRQPSPTACRGPQAPRWGVGAGAGTDMGWRWGRAVLGERDRESLRALDSAGGPRRSGARDEWGWVMASRMGFNLLTRYGWRNAWTVRFGGRRAYRFWGYVWRDTFGCVLCAFGHGGNVYDAGNNELACSRCGRWVKP